VHEVVTAGKQAKGERVDEDSRVTWIRERLCMWQADYGKVGWSDWEEVQLT